LLNRSYLDDKICNALKFMSIKSKNCLKTQPAEITLIEVMIVVADVHPKALNRHALYHAVYVAMDLAVKQAFAGG